MPIDTGRKTKAGRPLWQVPFGLMLAFSVAVGLVGGVVLQSLWGLGELKSGVDEEAEFFIDDEDFLRKFYQENKFKDPITNKALEVFSDPDTAVEAAKQRSSELLD